MRLKSKLSYISPYLFITPSITILLVFAVIPIFQSIRLAFLDYNIIDASRTTFIGFQNIIRLFNDNHVWNALYNTFIFSFGVVFGGLFISLLLALIITESWFRFPGLARSMIFIPFMLSTTIVALLWSWLYSPQFGLFNYLLSLLGLPQQAFLGDPDRALFYIIIIAIWRGLGYSITIWSAGILGLGKEHREAAQIDGANWLQELIFVRLPQLKPTILFLTILGFISAFQSFDLIYVLTGGGPLRRTEVLVYYIWDHAFVRLDFGYAATIAWLIFIILISLSFIQFRLIGRKDDE